MTVVAPCAKKIQLHSEDWRAAKELGLRIRTSYDPRPQPPTLGPRVKKPAFLEPYMGINAAREDANMASFPRPEVPNS
jgi:hypothetical protein